MLQGKGKGVNKAELLRNSYPAQRPRRGEHGLLAYGRHARASRGWLHSIGAKLLTSRAVQLGRDGT